MTTRNRVLDRPDGPAGIGGTAADAGLILASCGDAVVGCTTDGVVSFWNPAAERLYGSMAVEAIGRPIALICPDARKTEFELLLRGFRRGLGPRRHDTLRIARDGRSFAVAALTSPVFNADGTLVGASDAAHATPDRLRDSDALRESEARFRATFEQATVGIAHTRPDGRWLRLNRRYREILGYERDELLRKTFQEITHPDDVAADVRGAERLLTGELRRYAAEKRYFRKDGSVVWVDLTVSLVRDAAGAPDYFLAIAEDVTARRRYQAALRESEGLLRSIVETAADAIITIDHTGTVLSFNPAASRMFGYTADEIVGRSVSRLMPDPYGGEHARYLALYLATGERRIMGTVRELVGRRKDGAIFPIELAVSEVDHLRRFTGIVRDVSERKRLQNELLTIVEREQRRIGQELHDDVGQELTGLGLVAGTLAESLAEAASPEAPLAARLAEGSRRALGKVRALSRGLVPVEVDAEGLMSALAELTAGYAVAGDVECAFECRERVPVPDNRVATQLYRIAQEAVSNAVRHAEARSIRVTLDGDRGGVALRIADDGRGIGDAAEGTGLRTMKYRAGLIGATLRVAAAAGGGTEITCGLEGSRTDDR